MSLLFTTYLVKHRKKSLGSVSSSPYSRSQWWANKHKQSLLIGQWELPCSLSCVSMIYTLGYRNSGHWSPSIEKEWTSPRAIRAEETVFTWTGVASKNMIRFSTDKPIVTWGASVCFLYLNMNTSMMIIAGIPKMAARRKEFLQLRERKQHISYTLRQCVTLLTYLRVTRRCIRAKFSDLRFSVKTVEGKPRSF